LFSRPSFSPLRSKDAPAKYARRRGEKEDLPLAIKLPFHRILGRPLRAGERDHCRQSEKVPLFLRVARELEHCALTLKEMLFFQVKYKQDLAIPGESAMAAFHAPSLVTQLPEECIREILLRLSDPR